MRNNKTTGLAICIAVVFFLLIFAYYRPWEGNEIVDCNASFSVLRTDGAMRVELSQNLQDGNGVVKMTGTIEENGKKNFLGLVVDFRYRKIKSDYFIETTSIQNSPDNEVSIEEKKRWLPGFWILEGNKMTIRIENISSTNWIVYSRNTPMYFCGKKN